MIAQFSAFLPLVSSGVPVFLALVAVIIYRLIRSPRRLRVFGWVLFMALLGASTPLWPIPGLPRQTITWSWIVVPGSELRLGLDLGSAFDLDHGALSLLLLLMGAFACWSICRLPVEAEQARRRAAGLPGLLLVLAGGQLAVQSVSPFGGVLGVAIILLGCVLLDLLSANRRSIVGEAGRAVLLLLPLLALGAAVVFDSALVTTYDWWIIGCAGLLMVSLAHGATGRSPLLLAGTFHALGAAPLAVWLVLWTNPVEPAHSMIVNAATVAGSLLFAFGAVNVAVASGLRGLFYAQLVAGLGILILGLETLEFTPALGHLIVASLLLSLVLGWLAEVSATERVAGLRAFPEPLRHQALAYALAAASVSGLPLTLGYSLRRGIAAQIEPAFVAPLLLGGSTLLICGLLQPLAALVRTAPVIPTEPDPSEVPVPPLPVGVGPGRRWYPGILLGLLLVLTAPYQLFYTLGDALVRRPTGNLTALLAAERELLIVAGLRVGLVLLVLGFANRALRRLAAHPPFTSIPPAQASGWALPFTGLAEVVAPLTPGFWAGLGRSQPRRTFVLVGAGAAVALMILWWGAT